MKKVFTEEEFSSFLIKQEELNIKFNGDDWRDGVPLSYWKCAFITEVAEFLESIPRIGNRGTDGWKWYRKNLENDYQNACVEAVDIFHFGLSIILSQNSIEGVEKYYSIETGFNNFSPTPNLIDDFIENQVGFLEFSDKLNISLLYLDWLIKVILEMLDLTKQQFINIYNQKNDINNQRVEGGYVEGDYDRKSSGVEDNRSIKDF